MESSAGLYAGPGCNGQKTGKAGEVFDLLNGVIQARKYFDVRFNVPSDKTAGVQAYLSAEKLCFDEPTVTLGAA